MNSYTQVGVEEIANVLVQNGCYINKWQDSVWPVLPDGRQVPVYLSCRNLIGKPAQRKLITDAFIRTIQANYSNVQLIAGLATAGISWGAMIASQMNLPFVYVRSSVKTYGIKKSVEGSPKLNQQTLLIDDTYFTGESAQHASRALAEEAKAKIIGITTIANLSTQSHLDEYTPIHSLTYYRSLCDAAYINNTLDKHQREQMLAFYKNTDTYKFEVSHA